MRLLGDKYPCLAGDIIRKYGAFGVTLWFDDGHSDIWLLRRDDPFLGQHTHVWKTIFHEFTHVIFRMFFGRFAEKLDTWLDAL